MAGSDKSAFLFACAAIVLAVVGVIVSWLAPSQGLRTSIVLAVGGMWPLCLIIGAGRRSRQERRGRRGLRGAAVIAPSVEAEGARGA